MKHGKVSHGGSTARPQANSGYLCLVGGREVSLYGAPAPGMRVHGQTATSGDCSDTLSRRETDGVVCLSLLSDQWRTTLLVNVASLAHEEVDIVAEPV